MMTHRFFMLNDDDAFSFLIVFIGDKHGLNSHTQKKCA
jgi:hypothetical protein